MLHKDLPCARGLIKGCRKVVKDKSCSWETAANTRSGRPEPASGRSVQRTPLVSFKLIFYFSRVCLLPLASIVTMLKSRTCFVTFWGFVCLGFFKKSLEQERHKICHRFDVSGGARQRRICLPFSNLFKYTQLL